MWFLLLHLSCSLYNSDQTVCDPVHLPVHQQAHPNIGKSGQQGKAYSTFPSFRTALGLIFGTQALIYVCNDLGKTLERKNLWPCSTYHWAPGWTFWFYSWRAKEWRRPWGKLLINQVVLIIFTALQMLIKSLFCCTNIWAVITICKCVHGTRQRGRESSGTELSMKPASRESHKKQNSNKGNSTS